MVDLKDSNMNIVRVIKKPLNLLIRIYRRLERKKRLKEKMIECSNILKTGKWRITSYGAWILNNNGNKLLKKDVFGYKERNERFSLIDQLFGLKHFNVNSNPDDDSLNAELIYVSRNSDLKFFSFKNKQVWTEDDNLILFYKRNDVKNLSLFQYFKYPYFDSRENQTKRFLVEELVQAQTLGSFPWKEQIKRINSIIEMYKEYVLNHKTDPKPEIIFDAYNFVMGHLSNEKKNFFYKYEGDLNEIAYNYCFIPGHLDFNIGNILSDDENLFLVDNDDAGVKVPAMFDVFNLGLNEIYQGRSNRILNELINGSLRSKIEDLLKVSLKKNLQNDLNTFVFINFILRASPYVTRNLGLKDASSKQIIKRWKKVSQILQ